MLWEGRTILHARHCLYPSQAVAAPVECGPVSRKWPGSKLEKGKAAHCEVEGDAWL